MVSEEVDYIKKSKKTLINKASGSGYGIIFGYKENIIGDACFARLHHRIKEQKGGGKNKSSLQYILRYEESSKLFAYKTLIKELNQIFGYYFKITMYLSGRANAKIINIREVRKLPNASLKYAGYYMIMVLLRGIDGEYLVRWKGGYKGKKINNWFDMLYNYYTVVGGYGHGINDNLAELGQQVKGKLTPGKKKLYINAIENYLEVLQIAFGSNFDYKILKDLGEIRHDGYRTRGQTPTFKYVEKIIRRGGRK